MKKICVYTCITGDYDNLNEIKNVEKNVDYYCFTNNKNIKSKTWKVVYISDDKLDNHRLSRKIKMLGHEIINKNYDISVWMDADIIIEKSIVEFVDIFLKDKPFASFKHHQRDCIYEEAKACLMMRKDTKENILKTINFLKKEKYPEHNGLYEMTIFIKKHNDPKVIETMNMWFDMVCKYSKRDQLSFAYCAWKTGLEINRINLSVWNNEFFSYKSHNRLKEVTSYRVYFGDESNFDYDMNIENKYTIKDSVYSFEEKVLKDVDQIKIEATNSPYYRYSDITVEGVKYDSMDVYNGLSKNPYAYFINDGIIILRGKFKKNQTLKFSIKMEKITMDEIYELLTYYGNWYMQNYNTVNKTNRDFEFYKNNYYSIINSATWKKTEVIRKITKKLGKQKRATNYVEFNRNRSINKNIRVAVQAHVFYIELLDEIYENVSKIACPFDLYISTDSEEKKEKIKEYFKDKNINVIIENYENRGRDILPFILELKDNIDKYDYVCHIHTKKSKHCDFGDEWRKYLYYNLFGTTSNINSIIYTFQNEDNVGIIFPKTYEKVEGYLRLGKNEKSINDICNRLNIQNNFHDIFPAGSMFWIRASLLKKLLDVVDVDDFEDEVGQGDGTFAHAIERVFVVLAEGYGYKYLEILNKTKK